MKYSFVTLLAVLGLVLGCATGTKKEEPAPDKTNGQEGWKPPQAGEHHKHLAALCGEWKGEGWAQMDPSQPKSEFKGTESSSMRCNGLFQVMSYRSEMEGMPFEGQGLIGYDSAKKKYIGYWADSMADFIVPSWGTCSRDGKVLTFHFESPNPMTGGTMKYKQVTTLKSRDEKSLKFFQIGDDGKETLTMEMTLRRNK